MKTTLISSVCDNIGQVEINEAEYEIKRMNMQSNNIWHADMSDQMFCPDETDEDVNNPVTRVSGYCFLTCSKTVEGWK